RLAASAGATPEAAAQSWGAVGADFQIDALRQATAAAPAPGPFGARARAALLADLGAIQARLAAARLAGGAPADAAVAGLVREAAQAGDLAAIGVACHALAGLA
ncbi:hypothetical protein QWZ14_07530, partial [Paeniroseomonas aquatica]